MVEFPRDGVIDLHAFQTLPALSAGWSWELHAGRLTATHRLVTVWSWQVISECLKYWQRLGYPVAGNQYVADSGIWSGEPHANVFAAGGVVFGKDLSPPSNGRIHDGAGVTAVIETVSSRAEETAAAEKLEICAAMGVRHFWTVRSGADPEDMDGIVIKHELHGDTYEIADQRLLSLLGR